MPGIRCWEQWSGLRSEVVYGHILSVYSWLLWGCTWGWEAQCCIRFLWVTDMSGEPGSQEFYPVHSQNSKYLASLWSTLPTLLTSNKSCVSRTFSGSTLLTVFWQLCGCRRPGVEAPMSLAVSVVRTWPLSVVRAAGPQWAGLMRRLSTSEWTGCGTCHIKQRYTGRGHFPSFRTLTSVSITCVSCWEHRVWYLETPMLRKYIPSMCFLRLFVSLFPRTRYQYYLQVKKDVLEGRLRCTLEQVIRLAGLAVQGKRRCWPVCEIPRSVWLWCRRPLGGKVQFTLHPLGMLPFHFVIA